MRGWAEFLFLILPLNFLFAQTDTSLTFSEIMFFPQSGNNEFIEIYNLSSSQSIDLAGYKIIYSTSNADIIVDAGSGTILPPQSFAVIFEGDYDLQTGIYNNIIPANALVLKISDNAFGSSGMANTSDRQLWLLNSSNDTIETYIYSSGNSAAISDEKIEMNKNNSSSNWANSLRINGTPGGRNSVTPLNYDLAFSSISVYPSTPVSGDNINITGIIKNIGSNNALSYNAEIYNDLNFDSTGSPNELIFSQSFNNLQSDDSILVTAQINSASQGNYQLIGKVIFNDDEDTLNNKIIFNFIVYPPGNLYNDIVINEIMYAPSSGESEWIELYNRTSSPVNLRKWKLSDNSSTITITNNDVTIASNSFIILSRDSSVLNFYSIPVDVIVLNIPALNNSGDAVVIHDSLNFLIDSVYYLQEWGGNLNGKSLERISPDNLSTDSLNWTTSKSKFKATPGYINSVTQKKFDIEVDSILYFPAFPVFGDNVSIYARIKNNGLNSAEFNLLLFEDTNLDSLPDLQLKEIKSLSIQPGSTIDYDLNYDIQNLQNKKGYFILINYPLDEDTTNNYYYSELKPGYQFSTIVINEIMFTPSGGEPEWIELFNRSSQEINLKGWSVKDASSSSGLINKDVFIKPESYLVITRDTSIYNYHRIIPSAVVQVSLPSLNNDADAVVLKDERGVVIDSLFYFNEWGGTNGYSLERKDVNVPGNLSVNWGTSKDIEQSTPGRINSITPKEYDLSLAEIGFNPRFPSAGDDVYITAKVKNNGSSIADNFTIEFYSDKDSNKVANVLLERITGLTLQSFDSVSIQSTVPVANLQFKTLTAVKVVFTNDEDTLNNYAERFVQPGFPPNSLLISEVMFAPAGNEPEWFELFNAGNDSINLKNWMAGDLLPSPSKNLLTTEDYFISPGEYLVVSRDTSIKTLHPDIPKLLTANFGTLGNSTDGIIIYDFREGIIDSLMYKSSWGGKNGYSLERISFSLSTNDSSNWVTSLSNEKSTPGKENSISFIPDYKRNQVIINEIMFDPDIDNSEFIEFYNNSDSDLNIGGWTVEDESGNFYKLSDTSLILSPESYFLLIADSITLNKFSLNDNLKRIINASSLGLVNTGELILLKDAKKNVIDSLFYSNKWHNKNILNLKNKSLERIDPDINSNDSFNWSTSVDPLGATPGKVNSIYSDNKNKGAKISVSPNPFSPDNDGFEDFTVINYNISQSIAQVRIKIFDSKGRLVRTLLNNHASGSSGSVVFDGLEDDGRAMRIGIYIIFLEALNDNSGVVETLKTTVVVARKL